MICISRSESRAYMNDQTHITRSTTGAACKASSRLKSCPRTGELCAIITRICCIYFERILLMIFSLAIHNLFASSSLFAFSLISAGEGTLNGMRYDLTHLCFHLNPLVMDPAGNPVSEWEILIASSCCLRVSTPPGRRTATNRFCSSLANETFASLTRPYTNIMSKIHAM